MTSRSNDDDDDVDNSQQNFRYILPYDDERWHISNDFYDKEERSSIWLLCGFVPDTNRIRRSLEVPLDEIRMLPTRRLDDGRLIYPLYLPVVPPVCEYCYHRALSRIERTRR